MKQVLFKKMVIKNFLSIGDPVEINFKSGLNIITGINLDKEDSSNGVGKSAIAEALYFALFGETIRELNKEQIINNINKTNCKVIVSFDVIDDGTKTEYVVARGIEPTFIKLLKNGNDVTKSSVPKTTAQIGKIINSTPEVFANSVIMTANNTIPFMGQKKVDKRKFIEGILKLSVFSDMLLMARQNYNDLRKNFDIEQARLTEVQKTYEIYVDQHNKQQIQKEERLKELNKRKQDNESEVFLLIPKLTTTNTNTIELESNIELLFRKNKQCEEESMGIFKEITELEIQVKNNTKMISEFQNFGDICSHCKRPFGSNDKDRYNQEIEGLNKINLQLTETIISQKSKLNALVSLKEKCDIGISSLKTKIHEINIKSKENDNIKSKIEQLKHISKQLEKDITDLQNEHNGFNKVIEETQSKLNSLHDSLKTIKNKLNILDVVKFVVSEEGVKSFIVKKILKILNGKLAYYLKKLDANCVCTFNEYFEESIITDKGQECSYHNFSGGEKRRIDLAMLFTFMDIRRLQSNVFLNVSFYDEILDSSLDAIGIHLFLNLLNERIEKNQEAIYIITHQPLVLKRLNYQNISVINLEKKNGFTKVVMK